MMTRSTESDKQVERIRSSSPIQGCDSVKTYYERFCNWKEKWVRLNYLATEEAYVEDFIKWLQWDIYVRVYDYRSELCTMSDALAIAFFDDTMLLCEEEWGESNLEVEENHVLEEMSKPDMVSVPLLHPNDEKLALIETHEAVEVVFDEMPSPVSVDEYGNHVIGETLSEDEDARIVQKISDTKAGYILVKDVAIIQNTRSGANNNSQGYISSLAYGIDNLVGDSMAFNSFAEVLRILRENWSCISVFVSGSLNKIIHYAENCVRAHTTYVDSLFNVMLKISFDPGGAWGSNKVDLWEEFKDAFHVFIYTEDNWSSPLAFEWTMLKIFTIVGLKSYEQGSTALQDCYACTVENILFGIYNYPLWTILTSVASIFNCLPFNYNFPQPLSLLETFMVDIICKNGMCRVAVAFLHSYHHEADKGRLTWNKKIEHVLFSWVLWFGIDPCSHYVSMNVFCYVYSRVALVSSLLLVGIEIGCRTMLKKTSEGILKVTRLISKELMVVVRDHLNALVKISKAILFHPWSTSYLMVFGDGTTLVQQLMFLNDNPVFMNYYVLRGYGIKHGIVIGGWHNLLLACSKMDEVFKEGKKAKELKEAGSSTFEQGQVFRSLICSVEYQEVLTEMNALTGCCIMVQHLGKTNVGTYYQYYKVYSTPLLGSVMILHCIFKIIDLLSKANPQFNFDAWKKRGDNFKRTSGLFKEMLGSWIELDYSLLFAMGSGTKWWDTARTCCGKFKSMTSKQLHQSDETLILTYMGDIAFVIGEHFEKYLTGVVRILQSVTCVLRSREHTNFGTFSLEGWLKLIKLQDENCELNIIIANCFPKGTAYRALEDSTHDRLLFMVKLHLFNGLMQLGYKFITIIVVREIQLKQKFRRERQWVYLNGALLIILYVFMIIFVNGSGDNQLEVTEHSCDIADAFWWNSLHVHMHWKLSPNQSKPEIALTWTPIGCYCVDISGIGRCVVVLNIKSWFRLAASKRERLVWDPGVDVTTLHP